MRGGETAANSRALNRVMDAFPNAKVQTRQQFINNQISGLSSVLNILYVLLALSIIVSLFGIVNTLVLSVFERTREIGMLRAVGTSRRQVRRMIRHESVITALIGSVLGILLGIAFGALLAARDSSSIAFVIPVGRLIVFLIASWLVGLVAAIFPARRAAKLNPLQASPTSRVEERVLAGDLAAVGAVAAARRLLAQRHREVVGDRALRARGHQRLGDPLDVHQRALAVAALGRLDRDERVDRGPRARTCRSRARPSGQDEPSIRGILRPGPGAPRARRGLPSEDELEPALERRRPASRAPGPPGSARRAPTGSPR